jgi:hypothetical protein
MQWDPNEVVDTRVVSSSEWWIDIKEYEKLEPRAGVYLFANAKYGIKYVDSAAAGKMIEEIRTAIKSKKSRGATKVRALYTNSTEKAQSLKKYLIEKYDPVNNKK